MNCPICGAVMNMRHKGRYRRQTCGARTCRNEHLKRCSRLRTQEAHARGVTRTGRPIGSWRPKKAITDRQLTTLVNTQWLREEMFRRGQCAYHEIYFGHVLLVDDNYVECFEWDHIDRTLKTSRDDNQISRLRTKAPLPQLQAEVALCELVCSNCHQIKTRRNKDWTPANKISIEVLQLAINFE